jgi:hypothetical protein
MTEEFVRYTAECRRMARLAHKPSSEHAWLEPFRSVDWLTQTRGVLEYPRYRPSRQLGLVLSPVRRSI